MANHPLHPAFVHWPIALLTVAYGIDGIQPLLPYVPTNVLDLLPSGQELARISYYALSAGVLSGLPAAASGAVEAYGMLQKQPDIYEADKKTIKPKIKTMYAHAALNDIVLIASGWYWWTRRQAGGPVYLPETWMVGLGAFLGGSLIFAAGLGGTLVYNYGTGFRPLKSKGKEQ